MSISVLPTRPEPWAPRPRDLTSSEADLEWWHSALASSLGARGSGFEGSGATQWDDAAIWRLFEGIYEPARRRAVHRYYAISPIVGALGSAHRELARDIYESRRYPVSLRAAFPCDRTAPGVVTLVGAALRSKAIRVAYTRGHGGNPPPSVSHLASWLETQAQAIAQTPKWVTEALAEAREMRTELLTAYAVAARERRLAEVEAARYEAAS